MPTLVQGMPSASRCVFREQFRSLREVQDNKGAVVAATVDSGIRPTGVAGRVTFQGTEALLINATQATIVLRFKAGTTRAVLCPVVVKGNATIPDYQFLFLLDTTNQGVFYVPASAGDVLKYVKTVAAYAVGTENVVHIVYDGALAAASRVLMYKGGLLDPKTSVGVIPTTIRQNAIPLTVFNYDAFASSAPSTDFILREARIHGFAMQPEEVLDDANDRSYLETI